MSDRPKFDDLVDVVRDGIGIETSEVFLRDCAKDLLRSLPTLLEAAEEAGVVERWREEAVVDDWNYHGSQCWHLSAESAAACKKPRLPEPRTVWRLTTPPDRETTGEG